MAKKLIKGIYRTIEFLLGFIIILILLLLIRLWAGPIEIKNLSPIVMSALVDNDSTMEVSMKSAFIELGFSRGRLMDIRINELSAANDEGFALSVEQANVAFSPLWLLVGRVVVRDVDLNKPYIQLDLSETSSQKTEAKKETRPLGRRLNRVRRYVERLDSLSIKNAQMVLKVDAQSSILLPELDVTMERSLTGEMNFAFKGRFYFDDVFMAWQFDALYDPDTKAMKYAAFVDDVDLSKMQKLLPILDKTSLVLDAKVEGDLDLSVLKQGWRQAIGAIQFNVASSRSGSFHLPEPLNTTYSIEKMNIGGVVAPHLDSVNVKDGSLEILGQKVTVNASVSDLTDFFVSKNFDKTRIFVEASTNKIPVKDVPNLWPAFAGSDAHEWVKQNVTDGVVETATFNMDMLGSKLEKLAAVLDVQNASVSYVDGMLPVKDAHATVTFDKNSVKIDIISGFVGKVKATGGYVNFVDLDKDVPRFDMDVAFSGGVSDGLAIVSTEPLKICDDLFIPCSGINGKATGNVRLEFPFDDEDKILEQMHYSVSADLEETKLPVPKTDWFVTEGSFKMFVNNDKFTLEGRGLLDDKPMTLDITQLFGEQKEHDSVYRVRVPITASMITPYFEQADNFLKGNLLTSIEIRPLTDTQKTVGLEFYLKDAEISLPIGYVSEFGRDGNLKVTLLIVDGKLASIPSIYLSVPDEKISIKGKVNLPKDKVFELDLSEVKAPRTDAALKLSYFESGRFDADVKGKSLDLTDLIHGDFFGRKLSKEQAQERQQKRPQDFSINATLDTLYLANREPFTDVSIRLKKDAGFWQEINGSLVGKVPFTFSLNKEKKYLSIQTQDVGEFLRRAGYTDRIQGGVLDSTLTQASDGTLSGEIKIKDYQLTKTNFFVQAATLLGVVDALRGDTIYFDRAVIPFSLSPTHEVVIQDAVASGAAVGITARGVVNSEKIELNGSIVPAYALNSLFGKIPLVGTLLSGEQGGGLFSVSYSVTGTPDKPEFSLNPASLLTPGIFKRVFDVF